MLIKFSNLDELIAAIQNDIKKANDQLENSHNKTYILDSHFSQIKV